MKVVIADSKTGKSYQTELDKTKETNLIGKMLGEKIDGALIGIAGYSFEIRGGSDNSGFPMRKDIPGQKKISTILCGGRGHHPKRKGERRKKTIRGNVISSDMRQINLKVIGYGTAKLEELFPKKQEEK